jgi:hypothetical protein
VSQQVKITWSQIRTVVRMEKKSPRQSHHSKTELQLTLHNRWDSWFSCSFLNPTKKLQNDRMSASFTWLVTKRLPRPINLEMAQFIDLLKCYVQTVSTFWMTLVLYKPILVLYDCTFSQQWLQRGLKMESTCSSKMQTDFIRLHTVISQKTGPFNCSSISGNMNMVQH